MSSTQQAPSGETGDMKRSATQPEFDGHSMASLSVEHVSSALASHSVVYPAPSARPKSTSPDPTMPNGLFAVEDGASELNRLLNQISALSERSSLSESDWGSLRQLVARAVREVSEQEDADALGKWL